jgi:CheY-like chemotaxis protein
MPLRIVIIDDMEFNTELFQDVCFQAGFTNVCCFTDPVLAIKEIKNQAKPDLIITDNNIPDMKGTDVLYELEKYFGAINAVIITAEPWKVEFIDKEYPILEKGLKFSKRLLEFIKRNLKADWSRSIEN